jgi:tetratricopeptide (TPR) repeat protein
VLAAAIVLAAIATPGCRVIRGHAEARQLSAARRLSLQGMAALEHDRLQEAAKLFEQALATSSADERAHWGTAEVLWRSGKSAEGLKHMQRAVQLSGRQPELATRLGQMYLQSNRIEEAIAQVDDAIASDASQPIAWQLRGDIASRQANYHDALAAYHRALSLQPEFIEVQLSLAEVYQAMGKSDRMLATLDRLREQLPKDSCPLHLHLLRSIALRDLGRLDAACVCMEEASRMRPNDARLLEQLAQLYELAGRPSQALQTRQAAVQVAHLGDDQTTR